MAGGGIVRYRDRRCGGLMERPSSQPERYLTMLLIDDVECPKCCIEFTIHMHEGKGGAYPACGNKFIVDSYGQGIDKYCFPSWEVVE